MTSPSPIRGMKKLLPRPRGKHRTDIASRRNSWRFRFVGIVAVMALVFSAAGASTALLVHSSASSHKLVHVSTVIKFSPATQKELQKLEATSQGRAALTEAFQTSFGKDSEVVASTDDSTSKIHLTAVCASVSCGISSSGGWHFWIIASYAALLSADLTALQPYCWAALVPVAGALGAGACLSVGYILWELVNNWPRVTNHGVWLAVYWWGIQDGRY